MRADKKSTSPRFSFCPHCGTKTQWIDEGNQLARCPRGDFIQYDNPKPCVAVLAIREGKVLLGERGETPRKGFWDILGGFIDSGESAEEAAHREITEETALTIVQLEYVTSIFDTYGETRIPTINFCYLATVSGNEKAQSDVARLQWFAMTDLPTELAFLHQTAFLKIFLSRRGQGTYGLAQVQSL